MPQDFKLVVAPLAVSMSLVQVGWSPVGRLGDAVVGQGLGFQLHVLGRLRMCLDRSPPLPAPPPLHHVHWTAALAGLFPNRTMKPPPVQMGTEVIRERLL